jgi:hypothetical protein
MSHDSATSVRKSVHDLVFKCRDGDKTGTGTRCCTCRSRASQTFSMLDMSGENAGHSRAYACPYHHPTATMGHSITKVDISKLLAHTMPYTWSAVVRLVGRTAKFSETTLNITFSGNSSGGHSCSQHASCTLPHNLIHLWHCIVWQTTHFRVAFYFPQHKVHLYNNHAV